MPVALSYVLVALMLAFWAYVAWRLTNYPENHVGWSLLWSLAPATLLGTLGVFDAYMHRSARGLWLLGVALASMTLAAALYHFDVLLPYEVWLKRGMPDRPF